MGHSHSRDGDADAYDIEEGFAWGAPPAADADHNNAEAENAALS